MKEFVKGLAREFEDRQYAHAYMERHAVTRLAAQIHALRKQRNWSQEELAQRAGIAQERVSKIESADFESLTLKTLQKFSRAFDVNLFTSFQPFSQGVLDVVSLTKDRLEVRSRPEDLKNFVDHTAIIHRRGEWQAISTSHLAEVKAAVPERPITPSKEWQEISTVNVSRPMLLQAAR